PGPTDPSWRATDRYGQLRDGRTLMARGRFLYKLHDVMVLQDEGRWHVILEDGVHALEASPSGARIKPGKGSLIIDLPDMGVVGFNFIERIREHTYIKEPSILYKHDWAGNYAHHIFDTIPRHWADEMVPDDVVEARSDIKAVRYDTLYFPS